MEYIDHSLTNTEKSLKIIGGFNMLNQAIVFATKAHEGQLRKVSQSPFIIHPLAVGCLLADAGEEEDIVIAGILHDTIEDTDVTFEQINTKFGENVASLVFGCSENKALSWEERKRQTMIDLETAPEKVCIVTCADKIHNLSVSVQGIKERGVDFFIPFKKGYTDQKWYYGSIKNILQKRIPNHPLFKAYADVFEEAFGTYD